MDKTGKLNQKYIRYILYPQHKRFSRNVHRHTNWNTETSCNISYHLQHSNHCPLITPSHSTPVTHSLVSPTDLMHIEVRLVCIQIQAVLQVLLQQHGRSKWRHHRSQQRRDHRGNLTLRCMIRLHLW